MSLRAFHLFFVAMSTVLAFGVGLWGVRTFASEGDPTNAVLGVTSFILCLVLVVYGIKVRNKLKHMTRA